MTSEMLASAASWLTDNSSWLVPLGTVLAAGAAVLTLFAAVFIGFQARNVAVATKEIAGLAEVSRIGDRLTTKEYLAARRRIGQDYLEGKSPDPDSAYTLLDFMEDLALYEDNGYVDVDDLATLYSSKFICWWYVVEPLVTPFRNRRSDPLIWKGTENLIAKLHKSCKKGAPAWAKKPTEGIMRSFFEDELVVVAAADAHLKAD